MFSTFTQALRLFFGLTLLTGVIYPIFVTLIAQIAFPAQANGSIINKSGTPVGSELLAQAFDSTYFSPRPSACSYGTVASGASNLGPNNANQHKAIAEKALFWNEKSENIPSDLILNSGSGLDPHISPEAAYFQEKRIVKIRNLNSTQQKELHNSIGHLIESPQWGFLGNSRVNVLRLNIALDYISQTPEPSRK